MLAGNAVGQQYPGQGYAERSIIFDNASNSGYQASLSTYNWSHVCKLSARGLIVNVSIFATGSVNNITYGGVSLAFVRADTVGVYRNEFWALEAPAYGTNTVVVTLSTSLTSIASAVSYGNIDQTQMVDGSTVATGTGGTPTLSIPTVSPQAWVVSGITTSNTAVTAASSQTQRDDNTGALGTGGMADRGPIVTAGASTAVNWSAVSITDSWILAALSLNPFEDALALFSDIVGISNTIGSTKNAIRSLANPVGVSDVLVATVAKVRTVSDSVGIIETLSVARVSSRSFAETIGLTDAVAGRVTESRGLSDTVGISNNITETSTHIRISTNAVGIAETLTGSNVEHRSLTDTVGISSTLNVIRVALGNLTDAVGIIGTATTHQTFVRNLTDAVGLVATVSATSSGRDHTTVVLSDTVGTSSSVTKIGSDNRILTDSVGISDVTGVSIHEIRMFTDATGITETVHVQGALRASSTDLVGISGNLVEFLAHNRPVMDNVGIVGQLHLGSLREYFPETVGIHATAVVRLGTPSPHITTPTFVTVQSSTNSVTVLNGINGVTVAVEVNSAVAV